VSGISIHVVDVTRGLPARGMRVRVYREAEGSMPTEMGAGEIGADGTLDHPMARGVGITAGPCTVELGVGAYYRSSGVDVGEPAFQEIALFRFTVTDPAEHYHLPVKLSPWGLSIWRGR
jgi:5-hydroxyisourate hydrolase